MYLFNHFSFQWDRRTVVLMGLMLLAVVFLMMPMEVWAAGTGGGGAGSLPFDNIFDMIKEAATGPIAGVLSLMGIVAAGGMLIFGGDLSGFMRSLVFLVLVVALIAGAVPLMTALGITGAVIDAPIAMASYTGKLA